MIQTSLQYLKSLLVQKTTKAKCLLFILCTIFLQEWIVWLYQRYTKTYTKSADEGIKKK